MAARMASSALHNARALDWEAERENLIDPRKPTSTQMLQGAGATPSMGLSQMRGGSRVAKHRARALEHQAERENLMDPRKPTPTQEVEGAGATPSMGLSQKRGGARRVPAEDAHMEPLLLGRELAKHLVAKYGDGYAKAFVGGAMSSCGGGMRGGADNFSNIDWNAPWSWDEFWDGFVKGAKGTIGVGKHLLPLAGEEGAQIKDVIDKLGFGKHGGNLSKSGPYEGKGKSKDKDAKLEGGVWPFDEGDIDWNAPWSWDDFAKGFKTGFTTTLGVGKYALPLLGPEGVAAKGVVDALGFGKKKGAMRGGSRVVGGARGGASWEGEPGPEAYTSGPSLDQARASAQATAEAARAANTVQQAPPVKGTGKVRRRGAGPGDGRKARAEIVRDVMKQHGLKLIEASKYVKEHKLYTPKA